MISGWRRQMWVNSTSVREASPLRHMGSVSWWSSSSATCFMQLELTGAEKQHEQCQYKGVELQEHECFGGFFDRMMSSRITLYSTYTALCFVQMVFCCRSLGRSSPCWIEPSPGWTAWIRRRIAGRRCPPAALLWTPALHCTQPAAWPASLRTPVEGAEHRHINHLVLIQVV